MEMDEILKEIDKYKFGPKEMIGFANYFLPPYSSVHSPHLLDWIDGAMKNDPFYDEWTKIK